jgi:hypothetical protein
VPRELRALSNVINYVGGSASDRTACCCDSAAGVQKEGINRA